MSDEMSKRLDDFAADHVWVNENMGALLKGYAEQWIAVKDRKVIASDSDLDLLISRLDDPANTCIECVTREPMVIVL